MPKTLHTLTVRYLTVRQNKYFKWFFQICNNLEYENSILIHRLVFNNSYFCTLGITKTYWL